jgi:FeS assembly SUF system protein
MKPLPMVPSETPQPPAGDGPTGIVADPAKTEALKPAIVAAVSTVFDPEIPVNIYELGLIYGITVDAANAVEVKMTLTSPMCPVAGSLPPEVEGKIRKLAGVTAVKVELVWDPPWTPAMMSEAAKLQLNMF